MKGIFATVFFYCIFCSAHLGATTTITKIDLELQCKCSGLYGRYYFEVVNNKLTNIRTIDSTSDGRCDTYHKNKMEFTVNPPYQNDGAVGVIVYGYKVGQSDTYDKCILELTDENAITPGETFLKFELVSEKGEVTKLDKGKRVTQFPK